MRDGAGELSCDIVQTGGALLANHNVRGYRDSGNPGQWWQIASQGNVVQECWDERKQLAPVMTISAGPLPYTSYAMIVPSFDWVVFMIRPCCLPRSIGLWRVASFLESSCYLQ